MSATMTSVGVRTGTGVSYQQGYATNGSGKRGGTVTASGTSYTSAQKTLQALERVASCIQTLSSGRADAGDKRKATVDAMQSIEASMKDVRSSVEREAQLMRTMQLLDSQMGEVVKERNELKSQVRHLKTLIKRAEEQVVDTKSKMVRIQGQSTTTALQVEALRAQMSTVAQQNKRLAVIMGVTQPANNSQLNPNSQPTPAVQQDSAADSSGVPKKGPMSPTDSSARILIEDHSNHTQDQHNVAEPQPSQEIEQPVPQEKALVWKRKLHTDGMIHKFIIGKLPDPMADVFLQQHQLTHNELLNLECDMFNHTPGDLLWGVEKMFEYFNLIEKLDVNVERLRNFLRSCHDSYRENPFHNFKHSFSVTQMLFLFLHKGGVAGTLEDIDIFCLILAAVCHDLDHPGLNNAFQINVESPLAKLYNDESPLESYHASCAIHILTMPENNFMSHWDPALQRKVRQVVTKTILATDMGKHFAIIERLSARLTQEDYLNLDTKEDLQLLFNLLIKCADVSNEVRPFLISSRWAKRLVNEFLAQGDLEKELKLEVSSLFDKENLVLHKMQMSFIDSILKPMYNIAVALMPDMKFFEDKLADNRNRWQMVADATENGQKIDFDEDPSEWGVDGLLAASPAASSATHDDRSTADGTH